MVTPAPDLATLHRFEFQIEPATVAMLSAVAAGVQVIREFDPAIQTTPRYQVKLQMGAATGHMKALPGALYTPSQTLPDRYHAQLVVTTVTNRKSISPPNGARHDELVGAARGALLLGLQTINANLAWLTVQSIVSQGVVPVVQATAEVDVSPEIFAVQFGIRAEAWPALPAAS